ncbi:hypothetical protein BH23PAT2_BH23PAT2_06000 [soil metagenome]
MIRKIKTILTSFVLLLGLVAPLGLASSVYAQSAISGGLDAGAIATDPGAGTVDAEERVNGIIATVINVFSLVVGVISVIMIIIGGLKYITSGGDAGNVTGAKNTILYAVIGLVVVALAQIIVRFVLDKVTAP